MIYSDARISADAGTISSAPTTPEPSVPSGLRLDADTTRAARSFLRRIDRAYRPIEAMVFGSRARGTHRPDSDADLAVILKGQPGDRASIAMNMAGVAVDILDETGILISPLPLWAVELEQPRLFKNPALIDAIRREGRRL